LLIRKIQAAAKTSQETRNKDEFTGEAQLYAAKGVAPVSVTEGLDLKTNVRGVHVCKDAPDS
jgi:hypothetical protein